MTAATTTVEGAHVLTRRSVFRHELLPLYRRSLRNWLRVPAAVIPPLFIPVFFLTVNTAALDNVAQFFAEDYVAFFVPVTLLMTVATVGNGSGMSMVQDIDTGYFDKLLLAPIRRDAILLARLMVDGTRAALQALIVLLVALAIGADIATGPVGALVAISMAFGFGLAYAGIGLNVAIRTGSAEATQSSMIFFFPLVFLAPSFVPLEQMADWLQTVARFNPMTYVIEAMRGLTLTGWNGTELLTGFAAIAAIGTITLGGAFRALKARASQ
ncbi:MAG: ABC transporter permease [Nitriliruptorales bacterium]|nr:ABC transporter permease [Nitriliruptorales bacterium]